MVAAEADIVIVAAVVPDGIDRVGDVAARATRVAIAGRNPAAARPRPVAQARHAGPGERGLPNQESGGSPIDDLGDTDLGVPSQHSLQGDASLVEAAGVDHFVLMAV